MSGDVLAIIAGTVTLIALFLILTKQTNRQTNAAADVIGAIGTQYTKLVSVFMGTDK
jgi:hypothetical protein